MQRAGSGSKTRNRGIDARDAWSRVGTRRCIPGMDRWDFGIGSRRPIRLASGADLTSRAHEGTPRPRQGQGANQAIQDAGALASALATAGLDDVTGALADHEGQRVEQANPQLRAAKGVA